MIFCAGFRADAPPYFSGVALLMITRCRFFAGLLLAALAFNPALAQDQSEGENLTEVVCMDTHFGEFCLRLFPDVAPQTVQNFLNYVNGGDFDNTFFHRHALHGTGSAMPGASFVLQGGGYFFSPEEGPVEIPKDGTVINEFNRSNVRGTIAMAKLGNDPNSATSEWFINMSDNSANLDHQNGGFTVFGEVVLDGMRIVDRIARASATVDLSAQYGGAFGQVPLVNLDSTRSADDFALIKRAYVTKRDLENPANNPDFGLTTTVFAAGRFTTPLYYNNVLYQMTFMLRSTPPLYEFRVDTGAIVWLRDVGQDAGNFSHETLQLTVPSAQVPGLGITLDNIVLQLTNAETLDFRAVSYQQRRNDDEPNSVNRP